MTLLTHTCPETVFERTELAPEGECKRCDELRAHARAIRNVNATRSERYCVDCMELAEIERAREVRRQFALGIAEAKA